MFQRWLFVIVMAGICPAMAEILSPDLTSGEQPIDAKGKQEDPLKSAINLGPTGLNGWIFHKGIDSSMSRQILVTSVAKGSPANGILQVNPVSVLEITVDQSTFDTLSFDKSGEVLMDEIRFGPSYESVLAGTRPLVADTTPPMPK